MKKLFTILLLSIVLFGCEKQENNNLNFNTMSKSERGKPKPPPVNNIPAPTGLVVNAVSLNQANLSWNPVPGATTYWIYRNDYVPAIIPGTAYSDQTLSPGTSYTYAVAAVVNSTLGPKSASVTVTTPLN